MMIAAYGFGSVEEVTIFLYVKCSRRAFSVYLRAALKQERRPSSRSWIRHGAQKSIEDECSGQLQT